MVGADGLNDLRVPLVMHYFWEDEITAEKESKKIYMQLILDAILQLSWDRMQTAVYNWADKVEAERQRVNEVYETIRKNVKNKTWKEDKIIVAFDDLFKSTHAVVERLKIYASEDNIAEADDYFREATSIISYAGAKGRTFIYLNSVRSKSVTNLPQWTRTNLSDGRG